MTATEKLLAGQNDHLQPVLTKMVETGSAGSTDIEPSQKEAALIVAGILTAVKISIMQAGKLIEDMGLDLEVPDE